MRRSDETALEFARRLAEAERRALEVLGLEPGASAGEVRAAWRRRALECHPDRCRGDPEAARRFVRLSAAYAFLSGKERDPSVLEDLLDAERQERTPEGYDLTNAWGRLLWWRERFFGPDGDFC